MSHRKFFVSLLCLGILGISPIKLHAQASVNVASSEDIYGDIDQLVAQGLIRKIIVGQRPYSRRVIAGMLREARSQWDLKKDGVSERRARAIEEILERSERDYAEDLADRRRDSARPTFRFHFLDRVEVRGLAVASPDRGMPNNGLGNIDARINPLLEYRQGRHWVDGRNLALETDHWMRLTDYFLLSAQPRFQLAFRADSDQTDHGIYFNHLYGKAFFKNFEVQFGRDHLLWGQGLNSGLVLSNNARGLDMVKISNDGWGYLPWVFKYLGPAKASFFYADLGPEQFFPHSYLAGWKVSIQPLSFFEFGISTFVVSGGKGSPRGSFGDRVSDVFPFVQIFTGRQLQIDNKIGGFDFRFRIPPLRGAELYLEAVGDDPSSSDLKKMFVDDAGYLVGLYLPRVDEAGVFNLRLEYRRTGIRYYRHGQFQSGWTLNRLILGDNLGPDAQGFYWQGQWKLDRENRLKLDLAFERRSNDVYEGYENENGGLSFRKTANLPKENRFRSMVAWEHRMKELPIRLRTQLGYERVENFNFERENGKNNFLGEAGIEISLDRWTSFHR